jgi:predicted anti-sigma-YlaC factor YlaD
MMRLFRPGELSCKEVVELVTDYLEGRLSRRDRWRFERHLKACDGCTNYLEQMRETLRVLGRLEEQHISKRAQQELLEAFRDFRRR